MHTEYEYDLDPSWVRQELLPFLKSVFGKQGRYRSLSDDDWLDVINNAQVGLENLAVYEDFPSTVERVRMMLLNPHILTPAEIKDFGWIRDEAHLCIQVFVRHMKRHGTYKLNSLGKDEDPDLRRRKSHDDKYIFGGKFAAKRPGSHKPNRGRGIYQPHNTLSGSAHFNPSLSGPIEPKPWRGAYGPRSKRKSSWGDEEPKGFTPRYSHAPSRHNIMSTSGGPVQPVQLAYSNSVGRESCAKFPFAGRYTGGHGHQMSRPHAVLGYAQQPSRPNSAYGYNRYPDSYIPVQQAPRGPALREMRRPPQQKQWAPGYNDYCLPEQRGYPSRHGMDGAADYPLNNAFASQSLSNESGELPLGAVEFVPGAKSHKKGRSHHGEV